MELGENHRRLLRSTLHHIDDLLTQVETVAADARSPFSETVQDLSPAERRGVAEHVASIRSRMVEALRALDIPLPPATTGAAWAIRTALAHAEIALADATPACLRGYGPLADATAAEVVAIGADLQRSLRRLDAWLARGAARDLGARLQRLSRLPFDLDLLRTVHEVVSSRGLVEYQGALEAIVERLEADTVEVAFFGRISSGKSSLLNLLVGEAVLPVGVTPVTAVPTRIESGSRAGATLRFADGPDQEVPVDRLAEFVSERGNPGNVQRVLRASVRLPSPRLRGGLVLVDTPGVGTLATAGARASYHYLPRCDLGVVLVDAAGSLSSEDLDLLRLLLESGIEPTVLVSKIDLVAEAERPELQAYVRAEIVRNLAVEVPVHPVSTVGPDAALAGSWFERELAPLADQGRSRGLAAAGRKLEAVREGVVAQLQSTVDRRDAAPASDAAARPADAVARRAEAALRETEKRMRVVADSARAIGAPVVARSAAALARRRGEPSLRPGAAVREALLDAAREVRVHARDELTAVRDRLRGLLAALPADAGRPGPPVEAPTADLLDLPEVVVPEALDTLELRPAWWARPFGRGLERNVARQLRARTGRLLEAAGREFGNRLDAWSREAIARLAEQLAAQLEPLRASTRSRVEDLDAVRADLARLRHPSNAPGSGS